MLIYQRVSLTLTPFIHFDYWYHISLTLTIWCHILPLMLVNIAINTIYCHKHNNVNIRWLTLTIWCHYHHILAIFLGLPWRWRHLFRLQVVFDPRKRCSCPEALQHRRDMADEIYKKKSHLWDHKYIYIGRERERSRYTLIISITYIYMICIYVDISVGFLSHGGSAP